MTERTYTIFISGLDKGVHIRRGIYEPDCYVVFKKTINSEPNEVKSKAEEMLASFVDNKNKLEIGDVVSHSDGQLVHRGVALDIIDDKAYLLLCTTNKDWNNLARIASKEELEMFKFKNKTFLAPAIRPIRELYKLGYSLPVIRVNELRKEFIYRWAGYPALY